MKKTAIIVLLMAVVWARAGAQTMYDAYRFSENNYEGTARTMAMGNAFTALGGDLGSVNINPAGSAVARYSQFSFSPGVAVSVNKSGGTSPDYFGRAYSTSSTGFTMPGIGFTINCDTHSYSGIKNVAFGFVVNKTNNYRDNLYTGGLNSSTSISGAMATLAAGIDYKDLELTDTYDPYYDSSIPFDVILGYESGIISNIWNDKGTSDTSDDMIYNGDYAGIAENYYYNPETGEVDFANIGLDGNTINQIYSRKTNGYKYDYVFNVAANISDVVYIGANLGITSISYGQEYYVREQSGGNASDYDLFQTQFNSLKYSYSYSASGTGVYGKFGIIVTPGKGLRFGAAIQTPTATSIRERWQASAEMTTYSDSYGNGEAETPESKYDYRLSSPFRFNIGAAYTFGKFAVISADYEMADYSRMRLKTVDSNDNSEYDPLNNDIRDLMGTSHMLRAGIEIKPVSSFSIRAGYGLTTSPEKYYDGDMIKKVKSSSSRFSAGVGYSSSGSFFLDFAVQATKYAREYIYPYDYYALNGNDIVIDPRIETPEILSKRWLLNAVLTFGFRF